MPGPHVGAGHRRTLSADRILGPHDMPELTDGHGLSVIVEAARTAAWQH